MAKTVASYSQPPSSPKQNTHRFSAFDFGSRKRNIQAETALGLTFRPDDSQRSGTADDDRGDKKKVVDPSVESHIGRRSIVDTPAPIGEDMGYGQKSEKRVGSTIVAAGRAPAPSPTRSQSLTSRPSRRRSRTLSSYLAFDKHDDLKDRYTSPNLQSESVLSSSPTAMSTGIISSNLLTSDTTSSSSLASSTVVNPQSSSSSSRITPIQSSPYSLLSDPSLSDTAVTASASSSSSSTPFESVSPFQNKYPSLVASPSPSKDSLLTYHPRSSQPGSSNSDSPSSPSLNRKQYFLSEAASVPSSKDPTPLRRPSLFSLKATGTSTTVVGRIRDSIFGTHSVFHSAEPNEGERKLSGDVASRESSTYRPSSKRNSKTSDTDPFGLLGNLRPPNLRTRSSSSIPNSIPTPSPVSIPMPIPPTPTRNRRLNRPRSITSPPPVDLSLLNPAPSSGSKLFRPDSLRRRSSGFFSSSGASSPQSGISPLNGRSPMASPRKMSSFFSSSSAGSSGSSAMTASGGTPGGMVENLSTPVIGEHTESVFGFPPLRSNSSNGSSIFLPIPSPSISTQTSPKKRGASLLRRRSSTTSSSGSWTPAQIGGNGNEWNREVPVIWEKGSSEEWLRKLLEAVPRCEVATVLASSGDEFHASALKMYLSSFDFSGIPLDIALRQLLMEVSLPKETQQIDRVMEAFARQYIIGNPGLFVSEDHPYILAFSLIMLHTDAFNKSNKNKMTKADYIRNTRMDGVNPLVLDTFFDNITFTPFVFIEDDMDVNGQRALLPESSHSATNNASSIFSSSYNSHTLAHFGPGSSVPSNSSILAGKTNKIDVYYLISQNLTHTLRASVEPHIPTQNPFSYVGPKGYMDTNELQTAFAEADMIMIAPTAGTGGSAPGGRKGSGGLGFGISGTKEDSQGPVDKGLTLKLTKFGLLSRKEDLIEGGKKASNRRWKDWSVILTGSQLLFFKDPTWALVLRNQAEEARVGRQAGEGGKLLLPRMTSFKPDEVLSVKDCIAVMENSYNKYSNTFRFIMPHGRQYLLQAGDDDELNEWITRINYAAAFKTASVRMRGMGMTGNQAQWAGAAAAASHAKSLKMEDQRSVQSASYTSRTLDSGFFSSGIAADKFWSAAPSEILSTASPPSFSSSLPASRHFGPRLRSLSRPLAIDLESPLSPIEQGPAQLQTAFIEVKAELAAGTSADSRSGIPSEREDPVKSRARSSSVNALKTPRSSFEKVSGARVDLREFGNVQQPRSEHASRAEAIQLKIDNLLSKIASTEAQLKLDLRTAHNLSILAPFRKATRERIQLAIPSLARKIRHLRIELARFCCYKEILSKDLRIEADEWKLVKHIAHQAARSSLSGHKPSFQADSPKLTVPELEISMHTDFNPSVTRIDLVRSTSTQSSTGSFHSAAEDPISLGHSGSASDLPVLPPKDSRPVTHLGVPFLSKPLDAPLPPPPVFLADTEARSSSSSNLLPILIPSSKGASERASLDHPLPALPTSPSGFRPRALSDAEESPEEWSSTRAAHSKRISLAEVPTETVRRISLQLKRDSIENIRARSKLTLTPSKVSEIHISDDGDDTLIASREEGDLMSVALSSLLLEAEQGSSKTGKDDGPSRDDTTPFSL